METKDFAILNIDDNYSTIGVISNVENNITGKKSFKLRFLKAIEEHFIIGDFNYDEIPNLFDDKPYYDIIIENNEFNYCVRIIETWVY